MFRGNPTRTVGRITRLFFLFSVLLTTFAACGGSSATPSQHTTLVVWTEAGATLASAKANPNTPEGKYGHYIIEQFEKEHPGVTVKLEDHGWDEQLRQNLLTSLMAGTGPDIVVGENYFQQYAALGTLVPLDDVIGDIKSNLVHGTYKAAEYNGHIYGLSAFTGVFGFERNCKVVEAAGFDCNKPPQTWDELVQQAQAITQKGGGKTFGYSLQGPAGFSVGSVFRIAAYLAQAGASLCQNNCTQPYFNDPKSVPVYEFLRKINTDTPPGLTFNPDEGQLYTQLFKGVSAYQMAGSWHVTWAKQNNCADCRYSAIPVPSGGHAASVIVGNVQYAVLKRSKNIDLAKQWIKFVARDDVQNLVFSSMGRLPSTKSALTKLRPTADPATQTFIDVILNSADLGILPQWQKNPQQIWTAYNNMLTKLFTTNTPVPQLLDQAQQAAQAASQ